MSVTVRRAEVDDVPWLMRELKAFAVYFDTVHSLYPDDEYARAGIYSMIKDHLVLIAERTGVGPVGFITGVIQPHFYNPQISVLVECWWWVVPNHRRSRAAILLLNEFVKWGKEHCDWITLCLTKKTPVLERQFIKRGFHEHERCYLLEVA